MNKYESIIIVNPNVDEAGLKALEEKFTGLINGNGKVSEVVNMGKKKLAYKVREYEYAYYYLIQFVGKADIISELERKYRINENILKFITIRR